MVTSGSGQDRCPSHLTKPRRHPLKATKKQSGFWFQEGPEKFRSRRPQPGVPGAGLDRSKRRARPPAALNSRLAGPSGIQLRRYKAKFKSDANATQPAYGINKSAASRLARHCRPINNRIRPSSRMMTESPMAKLCKRKTIGDQRKLSAICPSQTCKARPLTSCR
jgi:hypothetical protein